MKRFLTLLFLLAFSLNQVFAAEGLLISAKETEEQEKNINEIGFRILNSNGIQTRAIFVLDTHRIINAGTSPFSRTIVVYRGMYTRCESDDELAAVLSHEIAHSVNSYKGILNGKFSYISTSLTPRKYEYLADKRGVDYMVNAGYNPVAMIIVLNKNCGQRSTEWHSTHPLTSRRMMEVYEYIYKKYPEYLANNKYRDNIYYQNFLLTSKNNREKFQQKVRTGSTKKIRYK